MFKVGDIVKHSIHQILIGKIYLITLDNRYMINWQITGGGFKGPFSEDLILPYRLEEPNDILKDLCLK